MLYNDRDETHCASGKEFNGKEKNQWRRSYSPAQKRPLGVYHHGWVSAQRQTQVHKITRLLSEITPLNAKKKSTEIEAILDDYIPSVEKLMTRMKKANSAVKELNAEIAALKQEVNSSKASVQRQLELARKVQELDDLRQTVEELQQALDAIPPEILAEYHNPKSERKETIALE